MIVKQYMCTKTKDVLIAQYTVPPDYEFKLLEPALAEVIVVEDEPTKRRLCWERYYGNKFGLKIHETVLLCDQSQVVRLSAKIFDAFKLTSSPEPLKETLTVKVKSDDSPYPTAENVYQVPTDYTLSCREFHPCIDVSFKNITLHWKKIKKETYKLTKISCEPPVPLDEITVNGCNLILVSAELICKIVNSIKNSKNYARKTRA